MPFIESNREFHERQGGKCTEVNGIYVYSNGALMESSGGVRREPHDDLHERAKIIELYWETMVQEAVDDFMVLKQQLFTATKIAIRYGNPPPDSSELLPLEKLQKRVNFRQRKLREARKQVSVTVPGHKRKQAKAKAICQEDGEEFLDRLKKCKL